MPIARIVLRPWHGLDKGGYDKFVALGVDPVGGSPADFQKLLARDTERWGKVIAAAGIQAQ